MKHDHDLSADVVIVGSGIAGALVSYFLAKRGIRVAILEAGPRIDRAEIFDQYTKSKYFDPVSIYPNVDHAPRPDPNEPDEYLISTGKDLYNPQYIRAVGGTTWHWSAGTSRFRPEDFQMKSSYGVGVDWPIGYDDLEPYYAKADIELGVSGSRRSRNSLPRSTPFPMDEIPVPYLYRRVAEMLRPRGYHFSVRQQARNSREYDGRPICIGHNNCIPICPIGAQYAAVHHIEKAERLGAQLLVNSPVTKILTHPNGTIKSLEFVRADNVKRTAKARIFVLSANALENAKLLLVSSNEQFPNGLANRSDQVGRNLMDHPGVVTRIRMKEPVFPGRGPTNAGGFSNFSHGDFRNKRAACGLSIENRIRLHEISEELLRQGVRGNQLDEQIRYRAARTFELLSFAEQLPDPDRRMTLDLNRLDRAGMPRMKVHFFQDNYTRNGLKFMAKIHQKIGRHLNAEQVLPLKTTHTANHLIGTTKMGTSPDTSVVDIHCRSHDNSNLFIAGSAVFPTSGGNKGPTLTIAAMAIRIADSVFEQIEKNEN